MDPLISRTEGVTLYADVKKFNLLKDFFEYISDITFLNEAKVIN